MKTTKPTKYAMFEYLDNFSEPVRKSAIAKSLMSQLYLLIYLIMLAPVKCISSVMIKELIHSCLHLKVENI